MLRRIALAALLLLAPAAAQAQSAFIAPTVTSATDSSDRIATTAWVNSFVANGLPLANDKIWIGSAGGIATAQTMSGDCTLAVSGVITCTQSAGNFLVNGTLTVSGSVIDGNGILATNIAAPATPAAGTTRIYVDSTQKVLTFKNDAGTVGNAVVPSTCGANLFGTSISAAGVFGCTQPAITNISGLGTGIAAALAVNTGSAGAPVLFNGAGGTPTSLTLTNATGLPPSTGLSVAVPVTKGGTGATSAAIANVTAISGATGTPSATTYLRGDDTWSTAVTSVTCFGSAITTSGTCATAATKSDQQTGSSTTAVVTPSQAQSHDSAAKAWAVWTASTGSLLAGYNATVARNSAGNYTVTFTTPFASTSYACATGINSTTVLVSQTAGTVAAGSITVFVANLSGTATDPTNTVSVVCFGRQ